MGKIYANRRMAKQDERQKYVLAAQEKPTSEKRLWKNTRTKRRGEGRRRGRGRATVLTAAKSNFWAKLWIICHCAAGETFLCRCWSLLFFFSSSRKQEAWKRWVGCSVICRVIRAPSTEPSQFEQQLLRLGYTNKIPHSLSWLVVVFLERSFAFFLPSCDDLPFGRGT